MTTIKTACHAGVMNDTPSLPPAFATWYSRAQRAGVVSKPLHRLVREAIRADYDARAGGAR